MNEQTIEMQIHSKAQEAITTLNTLISKLTNVEKSVSSIDTKLKGSSVKSVSSNINQLTNATDKATSSANKLGNAFKTAFTFAGVKRITQTMLGWVNEAIDYTEQLNLFNVVFDNIEKDGVQTFSTLGKEALNFQYKMNEAFGTNKTQTLYMQGIFQSMGETVGIDDTYSAIMSETMTKLTYDLASLYNKTETATAEAIRAGVYAGQTKPLRSYGIDVTQMSMQPILDSLGIDKQVKEMSQAEKEILRYLATLKQAQIAMGDLANTIESPSNQLKVFRQQLIETKVALSSLFIGTFAKILPYANAILMVIKEISKAIAEFFGIELKDYNSGIASNDAYSDSLGDIGDSADKASKKVKELKRQTLGFDEIHNINENQDSGNGGTSSGGMSGGIDQRLLDAIHGYDNGMDKVRMKALDIRDRIMEWLGFTKHVNKETGETYFTYGGIDKTLANMVKWWKDLTLQGKIWAGLGIALGFVNLYRILKKIAGLTGITTLFKGLSKSFTTVTGKIGLLSGKLGTLSTSFSSLSSSLGMSSVGLGAIIATTLFAIGSVIHAYNTNEEFKQKTQDMVNSVIGLFSELYNGVTLITSNLKEFISPIWNLIKDTVVSAVKILYSTVIFNFTMVADTITGVCNIISDLIHGDFNQAFEDAKQMVVNLFLNWKTNFDNIIGIFKNLATNIINTILDFVPKAINKLTDILTWIKDLPNKFFYYAGLAVGTLWKKITETNWKQLGKNVLDGIVNGIKNIGGSLADFGSKMLNKLKDSIKNINWKSLGSNILDGITNGMFNFGKKLNGWGSSFVKGIKDALGIHSPARLVIDNKVGDYTTDGIIVGMNNEIPELQKTANNMVSKINKEFANGDYDLPLNYNIQNNTPNLNPDCSIIQEVVIRGIEQVMSQYSGQPVQVDLYAHTDEGVVIDKINQTTKQTGVCPIDMPL